MAAGNVLVGKRSFTADFSKKFNISYNKKHVDIIHIVDTRPLLRSGTPTGERAFYYRLDEPAL